MATAPGTASLRGPVSTALIVVAAALAVAGGVTLYVRTQIVATHAFATRSVDALEREPVRDIVSREITVQLLERGSTDLVSARPVVESVVGFVVRTQPFQRVFRSAAINANRLLFVREGGNAVFDLADVGTVVTSAARGVPPQVARQIPREAPARLLELRNRSFATDALRFADRVRTLAIVLPALAVLALIAAVAVASERRRAVTRAAVAFGVGAAALGIALVVARAYVVHHVYGTDELTNEDVRAATAALWDAFLGDLLLWTLGLGALALVVAAASASLLQPFSAADGLVRVRRRLRPSTPAGRALQGAAAMALGAVVVFQPHLAVEVAAVVAGALLLYFGAGQLLSVVPARAERRAVVGRERRRRRAWGTAVALAAGIVALGGGLALALRGGEEPKRASSAAVGTCNGYAALCSRRLDQVVFAGSHNSMSNADTRGWLLVNQRHGILRQLQDGIRLFLIDPHYGTRQPNGLVRTDYQAEHRGLNRVSSALSPQAVQALERIGARLGHGDARRGHREIWLCHSACELGATRMVDDLTTIRRFLERNPGEVVILFDEDYVSEDDLYRVYRRAGLLPYLATLDRLTPLPTLSQLVRTGKRVIVFTERKPSGRYPWDLDGFSFVQDTPLGATKPGQLRCRRERGDVDSPLLMLNHWIDRFPPPASANRAILTERFILRRARRCERVRAMLPNLIASDHYDEGRLVAAVRRLNGFGDAPPAPAR
jgi:hypothetical protein